MGHGVATTTTNRSPAATAAPAAPPSAQLAALVRAADAPLRRYAEQSFPKILAACAAAGVDDPGQLAYVLATAQRESSCGKYMHELGPASYFSRYDHRRDLGNLGPPDGVRFKGRGYCQITGRKNYKNWSNILGLDLLAHPELAEAPDTAARIIAVGMRDGSFTGHKLRDHIAGSRRDFLHARRIINGMDHAAEIAEAARRFLGAMRA